MFHWLLGEHGGEDRIGYFSKQIIKRSYG
jgi:hypothetical protein